MGSLVVGNRMAFFSDALSHCCASSPASACGLLLLCRAGRSTADEPESASSITLSPWSAFGVLIGLLIAFVREETGLASDTVIGVFFAGSIGLGAVVMHMVKGRQFFSIEEFIFGNPLSAQPWQVVLLLGLALATVVFLAFVHNWLVLASASPSLALSRRVPVRLCRYLFVILLALMVNLSQHITGTLLINGLLIVPAATAANLAGNLRQMFWYSIGIAVFVGGAGNVLSWEIGCRWQEIGISGTIVVLSVLVCDFAHSAIFGRRLPRVNDVMRLAFACFQPAWLIAENDHAKRTNRPAANVLTI